MTLGSVAGCWDALGSATAGGTADGGFDDSLDEEKSESVVGPEARDVSDSVTAGWISDGKVGDAGMTSWVT